MWRYVKWNPSTLFIVSHILLVIMKKEGRTWENPGNPPSYTDHQGGKERSCKYRSGPMGRGVGISHFLISCSPSHIPDALCEIPMDLYVIIVPQTTLWPDHVGRAHNTSWQGGGLWPITVQNHHCRMILDGYVWWHTNLNCCRNDYRVPINWKTEW